MRPSLSAARRFDDAAAARAAWWVAGVLVATAVVAVVALWPYLSHVAGPVPSFLGTYAVVIGGSEVLAAALLVFRAFTLRTRSAAVLAAAYCISAPLVIGNLITLPGVVAPQGTFNHQAPPWCWMIWHLGWALTILAYAWLRDVPERSPGWIVGPALAGSVLAVVVCVNADRILPPILLQPGDTNSALLYVLGWGSVALLILAAAGLLRRRELALDAWVFVALTALALDLTLVLMTAARFSIGSYIARTLGALNALAVFLAVGVEYVQLARPGGALDTLETELGAARRSEAEFRGLAQTQMHVAHTLQRALLPSVLPFVDGVQFEAIYRPATREGDIGGNWYDVFVLAGGRVSLSIGEVDDRGLSAATSMVRVREALRAAALLEDGDPAKVLSIANRSVLLSASPTRATTAFASLDPATRNFTYASAGHVTPFLVRAGSVQPLERRGQTLGTVPNAVFQIERLSLLQGDAIFFYTESLLEPTRRPADGILRLRALLASTRLSPDEIVKRMIQSEQHDDIAILIARIA